jgi:hypothetical protein
MPPHLVRHLGRQPSAAIVHGQCYAQDLERRIQHPPDQVQSPPQLVEPFQRVELALDRDEHALRRRERVDREQAQRRRGVQDHVIVLFGRACEAEAQAGLAGQFAHELYLCPGEIHGRRCHPQVRHRGLHGHFAEGEAFGETVVDAAAQRALIHPQPGGGIALGVHVNEEDALSKVGERGPEADRSGGLPDAALLVDDGYDVTHRPRPREIAP